MFSLLATKATFDDWPSQALVASGVNPDKEESASTMFGM